MAQFAATTPDLDAGVLALIRDEREKALSAREWKFRLRGYGYAVTDCEGRQMLTKLRTGDALGLLPPEFA